MTVYRSRPTEFPVDMPDQAFRSRRAEFRHRPRSRLWRKLFVLAASLALTGWATHEMYQVLAVSSLTILEWMLLAVFALNISWICFAFVNATIGFICAVRAERSAVTSSAVPVSISTARTVIAFPVYNEPVDQVFPAVLATARQMAGAPGRYECFILSDTTDPDIALLEEAGVRQLQKKAPADVAIRYRRRTINHHRKAGNIRDFVTRWGGRYDFMIVYDADSHMSRETILALVEAIHAQPRTGLVQTIPQLVGACTLFARAQQFASALYGPVLGHGIAWWAQKEGNFWGHNAIIRVSALAESAGLPSIPGKAPLGGSILSHDFVEAALLRRAGWNVEIRPDLGGSYEEGPPTIIDHVVRDRRWCQGNMQHMAVLARARQLTWTSRFHLVNGIFSYLASPLWLIFITLGMLLSLQNSFMVPDYFGDGASLFPTWPVIDSERALSLFVVTMAILFAPKIYGLLYGWISRTWRRKVGAARTAVGVASELVVSVLMAPILMATQTGAVISVFSGRDSGWSPQARSDGRYSFATTFTQCIFPTFLGVFLTGAAIAISPVYAAWLAPATVGLIFSAPIIYFTSKPEAGDFAGRHGGLVTPASLDEPDCYSDARSLKPVFASLEPDRLQTLLLDRDRQRERASLIDPFWPLDPNDVHPPLAMARARGERASSVYELSALLSPAERMALLNSNGDMQAMSFRFSSVVARRRQLEGNATAPAQAKWTAASAQSMRDGKA
ncbi:glucans biosynthesis glucosyltransferase MdoH [Henriciella mobilis]|uniref:Glucans biosynthesis glucosyltransferase H n=1 Tax=Henriciella mobilis TaxID=2305467 RepID=A0A399RT11_9PROT|nr:glucans biosynthesis glucosyltransferase MdoH [Henriciella mobilis]RIJ33199.1 glucans biosynthesis glucosyltransferase MdoH [Henriciella mobilis]